MGNISNNIIDVIGNTPLVRLNRILDGERRVFAKLEGSNPAGSMKDRTSHLIISDLIRKGIISKGGTIIESSSGNMAAGLAQACLFYGLKLMVVVDPNLNPQTHKLLKTYGAEIVMVKEPHPSGGFLAARLEKVQELLATVPNSLWSNQYGNPNNPKAHHATMGEIMDALDYNVDYMFIATSTCGTLMGCAEYIEKNGCQTKLIAVDAIGSVLFGDKAGTRKIPGHGAGMPSKFLDASKLYDVQHVSDMECVKGCWKLLEEEAILGGGSSGGIVSAYLKYARYIPKDSTAVLLLPDRGERYLDTVYNWDWVRENIDIGDHRKRRNLKTLEDAAV